MKARVYRLALYGSHRAIAYAILFVAYIVHPLIHGTPLDQGSLDGVLLNLQTWAITNIQGDT